VRRVLPWLLPVGWAALLFVLSSRSALPGPSVPHLDKAAHLILYLVLGALLAHAASRSGLPMGVAVAAGLLYGVSDEVHQMFVPGRTPSVADWIADAMGVIAGVTLYVRVRGPRKGHRRSRRPDPNALRA
jgi:VanZ family protein